MADEPRKIVTLRITHDTEGPRQCSGFNQSDYWEADCGKPVRVYLPPTQSTCGVLQFEMVEPLGFEGNACHFDDLPTYICQHFLDMD
jgi:hypothetical protein